MFRRDPFPVKKILLWLIVFLLGVAVFFIILISVVSIKFGLSHTDQDGFLIPVLAGSFSILLCLFLYICFIRFIINQLREKDIIRLS